MMIQVMLFVRSVERQPRCPIVGFKIVHGSVQLVPQDHVAQTNQWQHDQAREPEQMPEVEIPNRRRHDEREHDPVIDECQIDMGPDPVVHTTVMFDVVVQVNVFQAFDVPVDPATVQHVLMYDPFANRQQHNS